MKPITRLEHFLAKLARDKDAEPITPNTRMERYLNKIAENMGTLFVHFEKVGPETLSADCSIMDIVHAVQSGRNVVAQYIDAYLPISLLVFHDEDSYFLFRARFQTAGFEDDSVSEYTTIKKTATKPDADNLWTFAEL